MTIHVRKKTLKFSTNGIKSVYIKKGYVDGIHKQKKYFGIWNGINAYRYMVGIQKSLKKYNNKNTVYEALYKNFAIFAVYQPKKPYDIVYQPFFCRGFVQSN